MNVNDICEIFLYSQALVEQTGLNEKYSSM